MEPDVVPEAEEAPDQEVAEPGPDPRVTDPYDLTTLEDDHTRYLIQDKDGEFTIDVPSSWKVTYGKLHGGAGGGGYGRHDHGNVLRLYENKEKQRAVFLNVIKFRDLSLPVRRKVVHVEEDIHREDDGEGNALRNERRRRDDAWRHALNL